MSIYRHIIDLLFDPLYAVDRNSEIRRGAHMDDDWTLDFGVITRSDIVRFAGAGGDFNPVHHDEPYALSCGYPSVFAMGMFTASMSARLISERYRQEKIGQFAVRFKAVVWPGERLTGRAIRKVNLGHRSGSERIDVSVINDAGEVKLAGYANIGESLDSSLTESTAEIESVAAASNNRDFQKKLDGLHGRIGEIVRKVNFPVEFGKVVEFYRAIKSPEWLTEDKSLSHIRDVPVPISFSTASALYASGDASDLPQKLGLDLRRTVHGEHRWTYYGKFEFGNTYSGITKIHAAEKKSSRQGDMLLVTTRTDYRDVTGKLVISEDLTSVELSERV